MTIRDLLKNNSESIPSYSSQHGHQSSSSLQDNHINESQRSSTDSSPTIIDTSDATFLPGLTRRTPSQNDLERNLPFSSSRYSLMNRPKDDDNVSYDQMKVEDMTSSLSNTGPGKLYPKLPASPEQYIVEFDGPDDPTFPQNWSSKKKYLMVFKVGFTTVVSVFSSAIFSTTTSRVAHQYHVPSEVGTLGLSLYVLGFAFGPIIWAPLSELKGRRISLVWPTLGLLVFQIGVATAKDISTILICRFWAGMFGAAPLAVVAGVFTDIFNDRSRGIAMCGFCMTVFAGPLLAPSIGGFITDSRFGWRGTQWLVVILSTMSFLINLFFVEETFPSAILVSKAVKLRHETQNWAIHAKQEEINVNFRHLVTNNFSRPLRLLFGEPIVLLVSIYMSFVYGILYLLLTTYALIFQQVHGMSPGIGGLPYLGMVFGMFLGGTFIILLQPSYNRNLTKNNNTPIPEWRLPPTILGGILLTMGLFWLGWSGYNPSIHWIVPTLSGLLSGSGILIIFLQAMNYMVDAYLPFAASTIAANSILRSFAGAGFPLFAPKMFDFFGINWACTVLGSISLILIPIPIYFYYFGARIRSRSSFTA